MSQYNQTKAAQKAYEYKHYGRPFRSKYMECEEWRENCFNQLKADGVIIQHGEYKGKKLGNLQIPNLGQ